MTPNWTTGDALRAVGVLLLVSALAAAVVVVGEEMGLDLGTEERGELLLALFSTLCGGLAALWYAHRKGGALAFSWGLMSRRWMLLSLGFAVASLALNWGWTGVIEAMVGETLDQEIVLVIAAQKDPLILALSGLYITVAAPVMEECLFRGFVQPSFVARFGRWPGIFITATLFGFLHITDPWVVPSVILIGAAAGWMREKTGGVGIPIAFHALNNSLSMVLYALFGLN